MFQFSFSFLLLNNFFLEKKSGEVAVLKRDGRYIYYLVRWGQIFILYRLANRFPCLDHGAPSETVEDAKQLPI